MVLKRPSAFLDSGNSQRVDSEAFLFPQRVGSNKLVFDFFFELSAVEFVAVQTKFFDYADNQILLFLDNVTDSGVVDSRVDKALHHGTALVVFNVPFPSLCGHAIIFAETLLSKISQR